MSKFKPVMTVGSRYNNVTSVKGRLSYEQKAGIYKMMNWLEKYPYQWEDFKVGYNSSKIDDMLDKMGKIAKKRYYSSADAKILNKIRLNYIKVKKHE